METIGKNNLAGGIMETSFEKLIESLDEKLSQGFKALSVGSFLLDEKNTFFASFYKAEENLSSFEKTRKKKDTCCDDIGEFDDLFESRKPEKSIPPEEKGKKEKAPSNIVGKCPVCGGQVQMNEHGFIKCQNSSCGAMFSRYYGRSLTVKEATALFNGNEVELENLEYNGKTFTQKVALSNTKDSNNWIKLRKCS